MWPTLKQSISNVLHPRRWKNLTQPQRFDVIMMWLSFVGIIFTGLVLFGVYVQTQEELFEKTNHDSRYNIVESHVITKRITIFTVRDSQTLTEYTFCYNNNGMLDNQTILINKKERAQ